MTTINQYAQRRIKREQTATQVALLLYRYKTISWTPTNIRRHVRAEQESINDAVAWLQRKKYVQGSSIIFLTTNGIEFVEGLKRNVSVTSSNAESRFKTEALLGIAEVRHNNGYMVSEQSTLTAAVLPRGSAPHTCTTPEDIMIQNQRRTASKQALASRLGITEDELENYIEIGRVRYCKSCDSLCLFDTKGKDRWQPVCRKCRKKGRA